jgi:hypothetical protein
MSIPPGATMADPTDRQAYALAHPMNRADIGLDVIGELKADDPLPSGDWLRSILAVDR